MIKSNTSHIGFEDTTCPMGVEAVIARPGNTHVLGVDVGREAEHLVLRGARARGLRGDGGRLAQANVMCATVLKALKRYPNQVSNGYNYGKCVHTF